MEGGREDPRGMKKEILIAWQVRLFRNIQRRCTECVPSPPSASAASLRRVETPLARMVSAVSCIPKTIPLHPSAVQAASASFGKMNRRRFLRACKEEKKGKKGRAVSRLSLIFARKPVSRLPYYSPSLFYAIIASPYSTECIHARTFTRSTFAPFYISMLYLPLQDNVRELIKYSPRKAGRTARAYSYTTIKKKRPIVVIGVVPMREFALGNLRQREGYVSRSRSEC